MSIQLVIAEKPSVARSIAGVIGADQKKDGYLYWCPFYGCDSVYHRIAIHQTI